MLLYVCKSINLLKIAKIKPVISPLSSAAVCKKQCMNGGKCVSPNTCRCRAPFSGPQCEERKKLYWCQNNTISRPIRTNL